MFDIIFTAITLIFVLIAFLRGFVKEFFSLINWIISILLVYFLSPLIAKIASNYFSNHFIINVSSGIGVFIISFIILALTTNRIANDLKEKISPNVDKSIGVIYGFVKSLLVFGIFYSFLINSYLLIIGDKSNKKTAPQWLTKADSFPLVKFSGELINPITEKIINGISKNIFREKNENEQLNKKIEEIVQDQDEIGDISKNNSTENNKETKQSYEEKGYSKKEIEKMNHLIEIVK